MELKEEEMEEEKRIKMKGKKMMLFKGILQKKEKQKVLGIHFCLLESTNCQNMLSLGKFCKICCHQRSHTP